MIASGEDINSDRLAVASKGTITENIVAEYGVNEGDTLGQLQWTRGRIRATVDCLLGTGSATPITSMMSSMK